MAEHKDNASFPKQIIVIRHAEKDEHEHDNPGASKRGLARANYLADFFLTPNSVFQKPTMIYAFQKKKSKLPLLNRSVQLVLPLLQKGQYLPSQFNTDFDDNDADTLSMVENVFQSKNAANVVLIVWEHTQIPNILQEIGKRIHVKSRFHDMRVWSETPWKGKEDSNLYSLTCVVDLQTERLTAINQSNHFSKDDSFLFPDDNSFRKIVFTFP
jgi:hypothetical protein